jgi:hypothetical protein
LYDYDIAIFNTKLAQSQAAQTCTHSAASKQDSKSCGRILEATRTTGRLTVRQNFFFFFFFLRGSESSNSRTDGLLSVAVSGATRLEEVFQNEVVKK